jgi:RNA polymerase sigma-70 factor (ECF subfamily)
MIKGMSGHLDFEGLVSLHYAALYRFAMSLTRQESDACDLTQQTFLALAQKGSQIEDVGRAKGWLFTTLYREFLRSRRTQTRFPHDEIDGVADELPVIEPAVVERFDALEVVGMLGEVDENFRAALALFYLEDCSYQEIAETLDVPMGTVKSRLARGLAQLQSIMAARSRVAVFPRKGAA